MNSGPDLGAPPERIQIGAHRVRRLIAAQFPQWADLSVQPVTHSGWDNHTFRLGRTMLVRLPSAAEYALAVAKEQRWLPVLAAQVPLAIPVPLAEGQRGPDFPFPWSIYRWIDGEPARRDLVVDPMRFARDLSDFLTALQAIDPTGGPGPGTHNWFRGGPLRTYDGQVKDALSRFTGDPDLDVRTAREIWQRALAAPWDGVATWFHGDVAEGNLLPQDDRLTAVIDFGTCGVGDAACDLAIAWTLMTSGAREIFRRCLGVDEAIWERGRGWALWKTLVMCAATIGRGDEASRSARRILHEIITDSEE